MDKIICHDCGTDYDLHRIKGHNRAGGGYGANTGTGLGSSD